MTIYINVGTVRRMFQWPITNAIGILSYDEIFDDILLHLERRFFNPKMYNNFNGKLWLAVCFFRQSCSHALIPMSFVEKALPTPNPTPKPSVVSLVEKEGSEKSSRQTISPEKKNSKAGQYSDGTETTFGTFFHTPWDSALMLWVCARWGWRIKKTRENLFRWRRKKSVHNRAFCVVPCHYQTYDSV